MTDSNRSPGRRLDRVIKIDCPQACEERETRYAPYRERIRAEDERECL